MWDLVFSSRKYHLYYCNWIFRRV